MPDVVHRVESTIDAEGRMSLSVVNVAKLVNMQNDLLLRASVLSGDLILADGMPLVWLSRLLGSPLPERIAEIDLMFQLLRLCDRRRWRVFFLGAKEQTLHTVLSITRRDYPNLCVCGAHHGYFGPAEEQTVAAMVREARPHVLLVAMTSPKKELFMDRWDDFMNANICHGVGGSFDVMAGLVRRAPGWMQRAGLEWLFRVFQEPGRMWKRYLVTNTKFAFMALGDVLASYRKRPQCSP
jgi:N-acetylglucosaminyldiphosphoundecaprenol N-acetyl-beta-D-mannosaminyltransferase